MATPEACSLMFGSGGRTTLVGCESAPHVDPTASTIFRRHLGADRRRTPTPIHIKASAHFGRNLRRPEIRLLDLKAIAARTKAESRSPQMLKREVAGQSRPGVQRRRHELWKVRYRRSLRCRL